MRFKALSLGLAAVVAVACTDQTASPTATNEAVPSPAFDRPLGAGHSLFGSWILRSAVVGDDELFPGKGFRYFLTFRSDGTHSVSVSGDMEHEVCPAPQTECEWDGTYTYTAVTITTIEPNHPDPDETGEDTGFYALCGGKLILMDEGDGVGLRLTFQRTGQGR